MQKGVAYLTAMIGGRMFDEIEKWSGRSEEILDGVSKKKEKWM